MKIAIIFEVLASYDIINIYMESGNISFAETRNVETCWVDLAPDICRQRLIIEGTLYDVFFPEDMTQYAKEMSNVLNMEPITSPVLNYEPKYGWCAFVHWKESGMHIYTWDDRTPRFFSVDIYTCKSFDPMDAVRYTEEFFGDNLIKLTWKE